MARVTLEDVKRYVMDRMRSQPVGAVLPTMREVEGEVGCSLKRVWSAYRALCKEGRVHQVGKIYVLGSVGLAAPVPLRREDLVRQEQVLALRQAFLDVRAVEAAARRVADGDGVLRQRCQAEGAAIDRDMATRSLAVHEAGDWRFHRLFWLEGGDRCVALVARGIEPMLERAIRSDVRVIGSKAERLVARAAEHKRILGFVSAGAVEAARQAALEHLSNVAARLGPCGQSIIR